MYGLVNVAVEDLVRRQFGDDMWTRIKARAGVTVPEFNRMQTYADSITYQLVGAASEELGAPAADILRTFGRHWITYARDHGYAHVFKLAGRDLKQFIRNLDNTHTRLATTFPDMDAPSFAVEDNPDGSFDVHYYSSRPGLQPFVTGLLEGLAREFDCEAAVTIRDSRAAGADHDVFTVVVVSQPVGA